MKEVVRVLLCDDRDVVRERTREALAGRPEVDIIGEAAGGNAGVVQALALRPDLILMDVDMPDMDGVEATRQILARAPEIKVLAFSTGSSWSVVREMLSAGASGFLVKGGEPEELAEAIRAIMAGRRYLSGKIQAQLTPAADGHKRPNDASPGGHPAGKAVRIALVDDSSAVRERVARQLSAVDGIEIAGQAHNVPTGERLVSEHRPDVLILDLDLPGQSGLDLLQSAKSTHSSLIVVILTNCDHPQMRQRCLELGADFFFHKLTELERVFELCRELAKVNHAPHPAGGLGTGTSIGPNGANVNGMLAV